MSRRPAAGRLAFNVLSTWGGQLVALGLSFFFTPFIVHTLGDAAYGVWILTASITGFLGLLDLGVRGAVTRYVARFAAADDDGEASRITSAAVSIFLLTSAVVIAISVVIAAFAVDRLRIPEMYRDASRIVLVLAGSTVGVSLVSGAYAGSVAARHRLDLLNVVDVAVGVLRTLGTVAALAAGYGIVTMAVIQLFLSIVRLAYLRRLLAGVYPALHVNLRWADAGHVRLILSFSLLSFLIHVSGRLIYYADGLVIGAFLPIGFLTLFAIGSGLVEYARTLISAVSYTTSPLASSLDGTGEHQRIQRLLVDSATLSMMVLLPVAITFVLRGRSFIGLWMGAEYQGPSGEVLAILSIPLFFHSAAHGTGGIMLAIGRHKPMIPAMFIEGIANIGLSIALVGSMGIAGVAWGTAIPSVVSSVAFWPLYIRRAVGVPVSRLVTALWIRPMLAALPFAALTYGVERLWPADSLWIFLTQVAACTPVAAAGDWFICLTTEQRATVAALLRRRLGRGSAPHSATNTV